MPTPPRKTTGRALDQRIVRSSTQPTNTRVSPSATESIEDLPTTTRTLTAIPPHELPREVQRDAPPPPPGYRYTLDGRLVPLVESIADLRDPASQAVACEIVERVGSLRAAADALGVSLPKLKSALAADPEFCEAMEAGADRHRNAIYESAYRRATEGYDVPIVGGRNKDEIVAYERRYSDSLTKTLLQRHFPEFRDQKPVSVVNVTSNTLNAFDPAKLDRTDRDHLRRILKAGPDVVDPLGVEDAEVVSDVVADPASS